MPKDLYFVHLSIHGLIRGDQLELGRDADTGGQCKYVLELVRALAQHPSVGQVDLLTRQIFDPKLSSDYSRPSEPLGDKALIRRVAAGPRRYLHKESLWRYLDIFVDQCLALFRRKGRLPDVIHAHYADAGYVGGRLSSLLGCPFIFTGHSLGRSKRARLLEGNRNPADVDRRYNLPARIEAEEMALDAASLVITSTRQEIDSQYADYECYEPSRMRVIPPGVDLDRFAPPGQIPIPDELRSTIHRFLHHPGRPLIFAIARADEKKNLAALVSAYGQSHSLRQQANLLVVAGRRSSLSALEPGARKVWAELLQLIDDYDLYGHVAIPKEHQPDEVPALYRLAAETGGIFVNPALTEPFGLTLIEAAASGLPILATSDGGPRDIIDNCQNGQLIDPLDISALSSKLESALSDPDQLASWRKAGLQGVARHYSWQGHVASYLEQAAGLLDEITQPHLLAEKFRNALPLLKRMIFTGLDDSCHPDDPIAIDELRQLVRSSSPQLGFGIASGRCLDDVRSLIAKLELPQPDVYITQLGGEIHYGSRLVRDEAWQRHLARDWDPNAIHHALADVPGLALQQDPGSQHPFKISFFYDPSTAPPRSGIQGLLRQQNIPAKVLLSDGRYLDVIPLRSGKGQAMRYLSMRWQIPPEGFLFCARRSTDHEALSGQALGVLPADHAADLRRARNLPRVYLASRPAFSGLLEGIRAYRFDADVHIPESATGHTPEDGETVLSADVTAHHSPT